MAVFFISDRDSSLAQRTRHLAQTFTKRHAIPSMIISEEPLWDRADTLVPVDYQSLHVCLESRDIVTGESRVLRRHPIDLKTFESIMPGQLNRNLASLSGLYPKKSQSANSQNNTDDSSDMKKSQFTSWSWSDASGAGSLLRVALLTVICALTLSLGYGALKYDLILLVQLLSPSVTLNSLASVSPSSIMNPSTAHITTPANMRSMGVAVGSPTIHSSPLTSSSHDPGRGIHDYVQGFLINDTEQERESDQFQVHVVGDCHAIVRPPQRFTSMRKPPKFDVKVSRADEELQHSLSKLFDGVYTLKLDREDAYGLLNVSITTKSKPRLSQVSEMDFGTPWLKISGWKKAARGISSRVMRDISTAQIGLSDVYVRVSTDMQVWMGDAVKKADSLRRETEILRRDSMKRTFESTTGAVMARSKQYSDIIKREGEKQLASVSALLQKPAQTFNRETLGFTNEVWSTLQQRAKKISQSVCSPNLSHLRDTLQEASKSRPLALAQSRARQLLKKHSPTGSSP